jgi:hypothetical protein
MLKLKPIAEQILTEAENVITWGDVKQAFQIIKKAHSKEAAIEALKKIGKLGAAFIPGLELISKSLDMIAHGSDTKDLLKALVTIGKNASTAELKAPKDSKWKQLTGPFWDAIKLSPDVSIMLDDKIEQEFINQVLVPELSKTDNDSLPIPNMDELLGKWLNNKGLKQKADIHFKGKSGDL